MVGSDVSAPFFAILHQANQEKKLNEVFHSKEFAAQLKQDPHEWAFNYLINCTLSELGSETEKAEKNKDFHVLILIESIRDGFLHKEDVFSSLIEKQEWEKIESLLSNVSDEFKFNYNFDPFEKILNLSVLVHNDRKLPVLALFASFPDFINNTSKEMFTKTLCGIVEHGKDALISCLYTNSGTSPIALALQKIFVDEDFQTRLISSVYKNRQVDAINILGSLFEQVVLTGDAEVFVKMLQSEREWFVKFLQITLSDHNLEKQDGLMYLKTLFEHGKLNQMKDSLRSARIPSEIFLEEQNFPILVEKLKNNANTEVFEYYFPLLENINYVACHPENTVSADPKKDEIFSRTLEKLKEIKEKKTPEALSGFVSAENFKAIIDHLINNFKNLHPGENIKLEKEDTNLKFTLNCMRLVTGEMKFFIELKSKKEKGKENSSVKGGFKIGKLAYEIMDDQMNFNLLQRVDYVPGLFKAINENKIAHSIPGEDIDKPVLGKIYKSDLTKKEIEQEVLKKKEAAENEGREYVEEKDKKRTKIRLSMYSEKAISDLRNFLKTEPISLKERWQFALELTKTLKKVHAHAIFHHDIKIHNVLVSKEKDGFSLKLSDFGLAGMEFRPRSGTLAYISPEAIAEWKDKDGYEKQLGYEYLLNEPYYKDLKTEPVQGKKNGYGADIWALGCTVVYILLTQHPQYEKHIDMLNDLPVFKDGFFNPDPRARNLERIIKELEEIIDYLDDIIDFPGEARVTENQEEFFDVLEQYKYALDDVNGNLVSKEDLKFSIEEFLDYLEEKSDVQLQKDLRNPDLFKNQLRNFDGQMGRTLKDCSDTILDSIAGFVVRQAEKLVSQKKNKVASSSKVELASSSKKPQEFYNLEGIVEFVQKTPNLKADTGQALDKDKLIKEINLWKESKEFIYNKEDFMNKMKTTTPEIMKVEYLANRIFELVEVSRKRRNYTPGMEALHRSEKGVTPQKYPKLEEKKSSSSLNKPR